MIQGTRQDGLWTFYGKSTDDKDAAAASMSSPYYWPLMFNEVDTGKKFYYDAQAKEWKEYGGGA